MSFFIKGKQQNGVKRAKYSATKIKKRKLTDTPKKSKKQDEEITSSEDEDIFEDKPGDYSLSEDEQETAQEKKLRLAKIYLEEIEKEEKARRDDKEVDEVVISKRLKEDYLKETGKLRLQVASKYTKLDENIQTLKCREQHKTITCLCISSDNKYVFVGSKDGVVVKYSLSDCKRIGVIPFVKNSQGEVVGHNSEIFSLAISSDSKYLAVGTKCSDVYIWDANTFKFIKKFQGHKKAITGLCFKRDSHTLYSCSKDRTAKVWSLDEMAYVETLFGHQDVISSIDALYKDRLVSCGGRDLRMWKIPEETQLIFNGHLGNIDNVKLINEDTFVSGGDDGQICIWSMTRKKPLCVINNAHGVDTNTKQPFWISAIAALHNTDLIASGSHDGFIRLWKMENNFKNHSLIKEIPVEGFVNCLQFTTDSKRLVVSVSKEHKYGRWTTIKSARNCLKILTFLVNND
ncbi:U3 small nucleolar RNA-interacting protein 2 [Diorhabda sublineata]|uniref:U3 small nucleolar RNA-interacting protein 2 n=1 Tax=Diorhabda sublineata TaxID=1163346 RepID=UPI0024E18EDD|nr:U3 small nucleolar RNA-interacting protein 2 [Diorhabda sublineata]